jgi:NAD+ synthase
MIERFISNYVAKKSPANGLVIGLSGGLDSSVVLKLSVNALGPRNVFGLVMPSTATSKEDVNHAIEIAEAADVKHKIIDLDPIIAKFAEALPDDDRKAKGNLAARVRMSILHYHAFLQNYLVAGTGDKSEYYIGYFTKYGDGGVDILPIADLYKTQVRTLARFLGVPSTIVEKKSSPQLWNNHLAEEEIGMDYEMVDSILYLLIDRKIKNQKEISKKLHIPVEQVARIKEMVDGSAHKRSTPEIAYVTNAKK